LYKRHLNELLRTAHRKIADFESAREVVQDAFITFYAKKEKVANNPLFYLRQVLKFKILEYYKKMPETRTIPLDAVGEAAHYGTALVPATMDEKELQAKITEAITALPTQQQKVFLLSREHNLSNKQIAEELGISVKTVEAHMSKALKFLKANLEYIVWLGIVGGM
jgi:RNA polymerase sigma-70 factor (ECF subfamily)